LGIGGGGHGKARLSDCADIDAATRHAANSVPSPLAGEGGRERSERPGEGLLTNAPSPASRLRRSASSPNRSRIYPTSAINDSELGQARVRLRQGDGVCLALIASLHERCYACARAITRAAPSKPLRYWSAHRCSRTAARENRSLPASDLAARRGPSPRAGCHRLR